MNCDRILVVVVVLVVVLVVAIVVVVVAAAANVARIAYGMHSSNFITMKRKAKCNCNFSCDAVCHGAHAACHLRRGRRGLLEMVDEGVSGIPFSLAKLNYGQKILIDLAERVFN